MAVVSRGGDSSMGDDNALAEKNIHNTVVGVLSSGSGQIKTRVWLADLRQHTISK